MKLCKDIAFRLGQARAYIWGIYDMKNKYYRKLEKNVPEYTLPDVLTFSDGTPVNTKEEWVNKRRPELLELFETNVYGKTPGNVEYFGHEIRLKKDPYLNGLGVRKDIRITLTRNAGGPFMDLLLILPKKMVDAKIPAPVFVGLNFVGNFTILDDPTIEIHNKWIPVGGIKVGKKVYTRKQARGVKKERFQVEKLLKRGYGIATAFYGDLVPDRRDGLKTGINAYFKGDHGGDTRGKYERKPDEWGAIGAWAWGLSRTMDYFELDADVDNDHVAVFGHSRLGKTALWAGVLDQRFAMAISNNSGCAGAALSRRHFGETVEKINETFPHWFCLNFRKFNEREEDLPVDQHMLVSLMAPRPVYIASAQRDLWADPLGEFLSAKHASPVYELFGLEGLPAEVMPDINAPVHGTIGYHIRTGKHNLKAYDWEQYLAFADKHFKYDHGSTPTRQGSS
ncbi:MAG: glucuronyl esterase domain-containing protein [Promethearchaeota archaeon]